MKEEKIQELLNDLFSKKFTKTWSHSSDSYNEYVVEEQARNIVEDIIRNHLADDREERIGVLEAKIFMYEEIIKKSTFAPMLKES